MNQSCFTHIYLPLPSLSSVTSGVQYMHGSEISEGCVCLSVITFALTVCSNPSVYFKICCWCNAKLKAWDNCLKKKKGIQIVKVDTGEDSFCSV